MEDKRLNREELKLWSYFKKSSQKHSTPCLEDNALAAYLDGKPWWGAKGVIEEHLATCPVCLEKLVAMRSLLAIEIEEAPLGMRQKAKNHVSGVLLEGEGNLPWWKLIFESKKSLGWGIALFLVFSLTGMRFGGEIAFSSFMGEFLGSNSAIESTINLMGV